MSLPDVGYFNQIVEQLKSDTVETQPSLTLDINDITHEIDGVEALKQTIAHILSTERYSNSIYDHRFGIELEELYGLDMAFVKADIERVIREALQEDDRIQEVSNFQVSVTDNVLHVEFTVVSTLGTFKEVRAFDTN